MKALELFQQSPTPPPASMFSVGQWEEYFIYAFRSTVQMLK